jgi:hypothetical protein
LVFALAPLFARAGELDPRGKIHIAIGVANTNDRLKTFVEPEGNFSPGVGSYGVYFWATDPASGKLVAPTMDGVKVEYGLAPGGALIPWSKWSAGAIQVKTEVCHTLQGTAKGEMHVVAARAHLTNTGAGEARFTFYAAVRPTGPAGFPIRRASNTRDAIFVDFRPALIAFVEPTASLVTVGEGADVLTSTREEAGDRAANSPDGNCAGALRYALTLKPGETVILPFVCPVHPGRRVLPHQWDNKSPWAQFDLAPYNPKDGGDLQPAPEPDFYRELKVDDLFTQAAEYYKELNARATVTLPDPRWADAMAAITAHAALAMNDDAPDVAVLNYNVFNRDGVYVTNILQKAGRLDLAARAIDYFLKHPFNGRVQPEADNPGQILWVVGQHWHFSQDQAWLERIYPKVQQLAAMVRYYRTTPGPHYVSDTSLEFGNDLPAEQRKELKPGACDGLHPEYTHAWDIAGLRAAADCARAMKNEDDHKAYSILANDLLKKYDQSYGEHLDREYGSYCVLWPCHLYAYTPSSTGFNSNMAVPADRTRAHVQFKSWGEQKSASWRYFPLAKSHQGLLAGNRDAGYRTINAHLEHEQMKGFYAFDEGGKSGAGGWKSPDGKPLLRTTWNGDVAMPHGWAIAELQLLIRDSLVHEDGDKLILFAGIPPEWFAREIKFEYLPTHHGALNLTYTPNPSGGGTLKLSGANPPAGYVVRTPTKDLTLSSGDAETVATVNP